MKDNLNYGIEFEFFIADSKNNIIPAYHATRNLDGNPVVGEIKTGVHDNIVDCIYELKKLIYKEEENLKTRGYHMIMENNIKVDNTFIKTLRTSAEYCHGKGKGFLEVLEPMTIYCNGKTGKVLPTNVFKASLQINISANDIFNYPEYTKVQIGNQYKYDYTSKERKFGTLFNYVDIIHSLDIAFAKDITDAKRVKGVYTIKDGIYGKRIEYRSLPNTVSLDQIIEILK